MTIVANRYWLTRSILQHKLNLRPTVLRKNHSTEADRFRQTNPESNPEPSAQYGLRIPDEPVQG